MPVERVALGRTDLRTAPLAVGTWSWGERNYWGYEDGHGPRDVVDAFAESVEAGLTLFDTAEVYGDGESEKILGWMVRKHGGPLSIATKFALLPGRPGARALKPALQRSLRRLGVPRVDLYQVHWPDTAMASIESLSDALADVVADGLVRTVGVSNFSADEMRRAQDVLARRGVPLASNQVHYSLVHRAPETDGVLAACRELEVTLLAYSPLEQGLLTGRYQHDALPKGPRARSHAFVDENIRAVQPLIELLANTGAAHGGKTPSQVALNWLMQKPGVIPIAGAKNGTQAKSNARALGWGLTPAQVNALDDATTRWLTL